MNESKAPKWIVCEYKEVDKNALERAKKLLAGISGGIEKALYNATSRATTALKVESVKAIQKKYDISSGNIRKNQNIKIIYKRNGNSVDAVIKFNGNKIPLHRYNKAYPKFPTPDKSRTARVFLPDGKDGGQWHTFYPGIAASGHQFVSTTPTKFEKAFVASFKSGHTGIFERIGEKTPTGKDKLRELMGSSVPQMIGNEDVRENLIQESLKVFQSRLDHETMRILNGWGK